MRAHPTLLYAAADQPSLPHRDSLSLGGRAVEVELEPGLTGGQPDGRQGPVRSTRQF